MKQKEKAAKAEARANEAEAAAGKGSYNPSTTKVLHLQRNPLHEALVAKHKNEVAQILAEKEDLEAELSALKAGSSAMPNTPSAAQTPSRKAATSSVDLDKKYKRLLENFAKQTGLYRDCVYQLTGYKVDLAVDQARPTVKIRSMYAEKEDDCLNFTQNETGGEIHSAAVS